MEEVEILHGRVKKFHADSIYNETRNGIFERNCAGKEKIIWN